MDGDVQLAGDALRLGPGARISGQVSYRSGDDLIVEPGAQVSGGIKQVTSDRAWRRAAEGATIVGGITLSIGLLLLGAILVLALPRFSREAAASIRQQPWQVLGVGVTVLVGVPVALVLLVITIIGIPLAVLLGFAYGGTADAGLPGGVPSSATSRSGASMPPGSIRCGGGRYSWRSRSSRSPS